MPRGGTSGTGAGRKRGQSSRHTAPELLQGTGLRAALCPCSLPGPLAWARRRQHWASSSELCLSKGLVIWGHRSHQYQVERSQKSGGNTAESLGFGKLALGDHRRGSMENVEYVHHGGRFPDNPSDPKCPLLLPPMTGENLQQ